VAPTTRASAEEQLLASVNGGGDLRTRDAMSSPVATVPPDAQLKDVAAILVEDGTTPYRWSTTTTGCSGSCLRPTCSGWQPSPPGVGRASSPAGVGPPGLRVPGDSRSARFTLGTRGPAVPLPWSRPGRRSPTAQAGRPLAGWC
jgi:hypothetical protein